MSLIPLINLGLFEHLTIPANRAPRGMNFVHTSRDYPLQELSNLLPGLWESSGLKALLWEAKASVVATNAPPRWHRHFFKEESFKQLRLSFFVCGNSSIPAIIINSFYFTAAFNLSLLSCILFDVFLSLLFHRVKK